MKTRQILLIIWMIASSLSAAYGEEFAGDFVNNMVGEPYLAARHSYSHLSENATVTRIVSNTVFLQTEEKSIRTIGVKAVQSEGILSLKPGDKVDLILDRGNTILAVTEAGGKGGSPGNEVTGKVQHFSIFNKWIALETGKGEIRRFDLRDAVATKLNGISQGRTVVLELDAKDRAMDAYRPE